MPKNSRKKEVVVRTIRFIVIFSLVITFLISLFLYQDVQVNKKIIQQNEKNFIKLEKEIIEQNLGLLVDDVSVLRSHVELSKYLSGLSSVDDLTIEFFEFLKIRKVYNQVRLFDETGMEIIRINNNGENIEIVSKDKLQNKSKRYYFRDVFALDKNQVYFSPLDLNIENGKAEKKDGDDNIWRESLIGKVKPMIRIGTPFYYNGAKEGIILVNYFGTHILNQAEIYKAESGGSLLLVNKEGYFLIGPDRSLEWGFMQEFEDIQDESMSKKYSEEWDIISSQDSGQFFSDSGLMTFSTISPLKENAVSSSGSGKAFEESQKNVLSEEYYWKIISIVPLEKLSWKSSNLLVFLVILDIIVVILFSIISYLYSKASVEKEENLNKLKKSNETKTLFLDVLRHDILNSVAVIKGSLTLILKKKKEKLLKNSLSGANKIEEIVELAKKYALVEGDKEIEKEPIDLRKVIGEVCNEIRPMYKKENVKLINHISSSIQIKGNKILREVFLNLLTNALKYAKEGKKVEIFSELKNNTVIKFVDYGPGIPDKFKEQIFERLERTDKRSIIGTGLGLAIVKRAIEMHNGRVFVEDNPKGGSIFVVELPK